MLKLLHRLRARYQYRHEEAGGFKNLILHTAFALSLTSGLSYFLGLVRDKSFAYTFGASAELDVYNAAFVIPDLFLAVLVTSALSAAFVPIFSNFDEQQKAKAIRYTNQVLSYGLLFLAIVCAVFALILPNIVDFLVPGFNHEQQAQYISITRLMLISPFLFTISNTFGNALISIKEFLWYGLSPVMYNLGIVMGVILFVPSMGLMGLVLGTVLGAFLHLLIRIPSMIRYGYRPRVELEITPEIRETVLLMLPKIAQIGMWQLLLWWFVRLASQLEEGSVTIYSFARNFQSVPVSLVGIAIALAAFARLSHVASNRDYKEFVKTVKEKTRIILLYTTPAALAMGILSYPMVNILLGGGKFDATAVSATASLLLVYCLSIPLESLMHLLSRAHYAMKNTLRPSAIHVFTIAMTMLSSSLLLGPIGLFAIPAGFTVGLFLQIILLKLSLAHLLRRHRSA
ncbi:MAG: murein biosynthesis integral membrane protein MurJ [bacterium]|nr:murein biosynthesis integral membrane protein MurJ [bacterium]